ncbi:MAG: DUF3390 domain-containing protein, partial [Actinobacteria bacterium]|nr:DUF3390 domain-containing protein [Actinomycetota bacterium]
ACPVAIDIPTMLVHLRARVTETKGRTPERAAMTAAAWTMRSPRRWTLALRAARLGRLLPRSLRQGRRPLPPPLAGWTASRDLPVPPKHSLRDTWDGR